MQIYEDEFLIIGLQVAFLAEFPHPNFPKGRRCSLGCWLIIFQYNLMWKKFIHMSSPPLEGLGEDFRGGV